MSTSKPRFGRVAILAGGGELPLMIAASVEAGGGTVHIVAIEGEADAAIERFPHTWVNFAQATRMFAALRGSAEAPRPNVMVIAGAVQRPDLLSLRPDAGLAKVLVKVLRFITAGGDDALLTRVIRLFEDEGLTVVGVQDVAPELLIGTGVLGRHVPDAAALADIDLAGRLIARLGDLDVGQAVAVGGGRVLAIEGAEGTDRMLARLIATGPHQDAILLKAPKPRQERRVDLPTIGLRTVEGARAAGLRGIAVVAGQAIGLQRQDMIAGADAAGLFVCGLAQPPLDAAPPVETPDPVVVGTRKAGADDLADARHAAAAVLGLAPFATGKAAVVVRRHALAVSAIETPAQLLERIGALSQWGLARWSRRGACVVRIDDKADLDTAQALIERVAATRLAGLGLVTDRPLPPALAAAADRARVFLVRIPVGRG